MLDESKEIWTQETVILRPASPGELLNATISTLWHTKLVHILPDRLPSMNPGEMDQLYSRLGAELFAHLSEDAGSRTWGTHPRETWIEVVSKSASKGKDQPRALHTDEAGMRDPANIALMYCVEAASSGGGNNFISSDRLWHRLVSADPPLAEQLLSCPVPYKDERGISYQPILRRHRGRVFANFNAKLIQRGLNTMADELVTSFERFLETRLDQSDLFDVTLTAGGAMLWWDNLFLHGRRPVEAGAELRRYRKAGIVVRPEPARRLCNARRARHVRRGNPRRGSKASGGDRGHDCGEEVHRSIIKEIATRRTCGPFVVGVDGMNAVGKTAFALRLASAARRCGSFDNVTVISIDDFHWPKRRRYADDFASRAFRDGYFDRVRLLDNVLRPLRKHGNLRTELTLLDLRSDEYLDVRRIQISPRGLLIIEGVFLFQDDMLPYLDFTIFLDCSVPVSLRRVVERGGNDGEWFGSLLAKFLDRYLPGNMRHAHTHAPWTRATLVIDMTDHDKPKLTNNRESNWPV